MERLPCCASAPATWIQGADGKLGYGMFPGGWDPNGGLHPTVGAAASGSCWDWGPAKGPCRPGSCLGLFLMSLRDNSGSALLTLSLGSDGGLNPVLEPQFLGPGGVLGPVLVLQSLQPYGYSCPALELQCPGSQLSLDPLLVLQSHHLGGCPGPALLSHAPGFDQCSGLAPVSHLPGFDGCLGAVSQCPGPWLLRDLLVAGDPPRCMQPWPLLPTCLLLRCQLLTIFWCLVLLEWLPTSLGHLEHQAEQLTEVNPAVAVIIQEA